MSRPIVYHTEASPPSRAVRLAAAAIGLDVDVRHIDLLAGEHLKEEFLKVGVMFDHGQNFRLKNFTSSTVKSTTHGADPR